MKIKDIKRTEGRQVFSIKPGAGLSEAIDQLVSHKIGALVVSESDGTLAGIISERDILRWLHRSNAEIGKARVKDIMTREVVTADPEDNLEDILKKMTEKNVRHLPIISEGKISGILSLRDVIEEQLTECSSKVEYLHDYISGGMK